MAQASTQTETIDLPNARIQDQWASECPTLEGTHFVCVKTEDDNPELSYIIGQFQEAGYEINSIDFKWNTVTFVK